MTFLLGRLNYKFKHKFKSWFSVYLRDRFTKVPTDDDFSEDIVMRYSLPQGSITGPHRFILYTSPVGNIMRALISLSTLMLMIYSCTLGLIPDVKVICEGVLVRLSSCIDVINEWMIQNTLRLNQDKRVFLIANRNVSDIIVWIWICPFRDLHQSKILCHLWLFFHYVFSRQHYCKSVHFL